MKILLDTCVVVDALQDREPFAQAAKEIFRKAAANEFVACITAKAATDMYYLTHRCTHSDVEAREILKKIFSLFDVLDTTGQDCKNALFSPMSDFEDAVMAETGLRYALDFIVTRNTSDYLECPLPVLCPESFLQLLEEGGASKNGSSRQART